MIDEKKQKEFLNKAEQLVTKTIDDVFKSETFICSMYLLKYIYDKDESYFNKFIERFSNFTPQEQMQVMSNVYANLVGQGKLKKSEEKPKKAK